MAEKPYARYGIFWFPNRGWEPEDAIIVRRVSLMTEEKPIRILIADDHPVVRRGLTSLINIKSGMELVGEAADGVEVVEKAQALQPDVILLDLMMPRKDGLEAIKEIKQANPDARILVVTSF